MYNADKPIKSKSEDLLGRGEFAQQLAEAITTLSTTDTFVVGLYGEWGSGKTSLLNLTEEMLLRLSGKNKHPRITLIRFNPWGYTDVNQLVWQFFSSLAVKYKAIDKDKNLEEIGSSIEKYSFSLAATNFIPGVGVYLAPLPLIAKLLGKTIQKKAAIRRQDVMQQKALVVKALAKSKNKTVIIIDDLDRLPNNQIRMIFQLVNSIADFPNTTYLLSFDKEIVCRAMSKEQDCNGEEYLEKIIQIPFEIPFVKSETIHRILHDILISICPTETDPTFNPEHWQSVFDNCISPYIKTIRDINRFVNALNFKFQPLRDEINFIDLAGITAIQVFDTPIYEWIIHNRDDLLGWSSRYLDAGLFGDEIDLKNQYRSIFEKIHPVEFQKNILAVASLYPVFCASVGESLETPRADNELRRSLSIASANRFYLYFTLSLVDISVSQKDLNASVDNLNEVELDELLVKYLKVGVISDYFFALSAKLNNLPETRIRILTKALYNLRFDIHNDFHSSEDFQYLLHCQHVLSESLLLIQDEEARCNLYCELIYEASEESIWRNAQHLYLMEQSLQRVPYEQVSIRKPVFSVSSLKLIETSFITRLIDISSSLEIFYWNHYSACSMIWKSFGKVQYEEYMSTVLKVPENRLKYIALQMTVSVRPLEEKQYVYNRNILLGDLINGDDAIKIIESSLLDQSIFSQPVFILDRLAAFYVQFSRNELNAVLPVSVNETVLQIKRWRDEHLTQSDT